MKYAGQVGVAALGLALLVGGAQTVAAQQSFPQTLYWGAGLVDIPVAWVSPISGDMAVNYSGKMFRSDPDATKINWSNRVNSQLAMSLSAFGRVTAGFAAYSSNPEWGFFGRALLLSQNDVSPESALHWFVPSIAVGVRNVGPYSHIDRFGIGYDLLPPSPTNANARHVADSLHQHFNTANTMYGVMTKGWSLRQFNTTLPDVDASVSVGYGNGLFKDDGGLGAAYAKHATGGLFYGAAVDFTPAQHLTMTVMAENNAWDYNVGASLAYRGVRAGVYLTELGAGSATPFAGAGGGYTGDYQKFAFTLGWQSNVFAVLRGDFLQRQESALLLEHQRLLAEVTVRQQHIAALELEINRYEAQGLLGLEQRRATAETQLSEERDALKRLEDRLHQLEQQLPPDSNPQQPPVPPGKP